MGDPAYGYIILRPIRSRVLGDLISFVGVWLKGSRQRWGETGGWRYGEMWLMPSVGKHWHFPLERPWLASICIMRGMSQWALGGHASLGRQWGHRPVAYMVNTLWKQRFIVTSGWWSLEQETVRSSEVLDGAPRQNSGNVVVTRFMDCRNIHVLQWKHNEQKETVIT